MKCCVGLHFGFFLEIVLIIYRCFCCCAVLTHGQGLFSLSYPHASKLSGSSTRCWEETLLGQMTAIDERIFHTIRNHTQHKNLGIVFWGPLLRHRLLITWLVMINYFHRQNLSFLAFISLVFNFSSSLHYITIVIIITIIILFLLLNFFYLHHNFSHFYPFVWV